MSSKRSLGEVLRNKILKVKKRCVASFGSADMLYQTAEKRHQVDSRLVRNAHAEKAHETGVGHPRRHGEVHDVQRTAEAMAENWCS